MAHKRLKTLLNIISLILIGVISFVLCYQILYKHWTPKTYVSPNEEITFDKEIINHSVAATVSILGEAMVNNRPDPSAGSGFFISDDGLIVTNQHVIDNCNLIIVIDCNGKKYKANVISSDKRSDIAIIKIDTQNASYFEFGNSEELAHGQPVFSLGNQLGDAAKGNTVVSVGRITQFNNTFNLDFNNDRFYSNLIQINSPTYPGNSGGPLVNADGKVIGIMSVASTNLLTKQNAGYAIAIDDDFRNIISDLAAGKTISHGFLGTTHSDQIPLDLVDKYQLSDLSGAYVSMVLPDSPAQHAGIRKNDIIKTIDGISINNSSDLIAYINRKLPGTEIDISLLRPTYNDIKEIELTAKLEPRTTTNRNGYFEEKNLPEAAAWGITVKPITKWRRNKSHIPAALSGVMIYDLGSDPKISILDIQPGDIITHINDQPIRSIYEFTLEANNSVFFPTITTWQNRTTALEAKLNK